MGRQKLIAFAISYILWPLLVHPHKSAKFKGVKIDNLTEKNTPRFSRFPTRKLLIGANNYDVKFCFQSGRVWRLQNVRAWSSTFVGLALQMTTALVNNLLEITTRGMSISPQQ